MKKKLIPILISALCVLNSGQLMANQDGNHTASEKEDISVGVGAISGALIAGPVGFFVGGLVGVLFSRDDTDETSVVAELDVADELTIETTADIHNDATIAVAVTDTVADTEKTNQSDELFVASASNDAFLIEHKKTEEANKLKAIITDSLNIVVYFTPGSVTTETFYQEQFATVLHLLQEMPEIDLNLAGYSDRRGTDVENVQLASQRVASIRDYFIQHGIDENRIQTHAYGETNLLSTSGELDSYMFDRRVVLSFNAAADDLQNNVATTESEPETTIKTTTTLSDASPF